MPPAPAPPKVILGTDKRPLTLILQYWALYRGLTDPAVDPRPPYLDVFIDISRRRRRYCAENVHDLR